MVGSPAGVGLRGDLLRGVAVANEDWCFDGGSSGVEACPYGERSRVRTLEEPALLWSLHTPTSESACS